MAYKGPAGLPEAPCEKDAGMYHVFHVAGDHLKCWIHVEALKAFHEQGALADGSYLFFVEGAGRLRLFFENDLPVKEESRKEELKT
ncbi:MAG: trimethylamine--corrinoid methyltransferase [Thermovirgaceae bacterium]